MSILSHCSGRENHPFVVPGGMVSIGITGMIRTVVIGRYAIAVGLMGAGLARPGAWVGRRGLATRTCLIIDRTMRYVQNTMAARQEAPSIPSVLTSRTTPRRRVLNVTLRDGGCDSVREALVREQTHKPRHKAVRTAPAPLPAPLFESPSPGRTFRPRALLLTPCLGKPNGVARA